MRRARFPNGQAFRNVQAILKFYCFETGLDSSNESPDLCFWLLHNEQTAIFKHGRENNCTQIQFCLTKDFAFFC